VGGYCYVGVWLFTESIVDMRLLTAVELILFTMLSMPCLLDDPRSSHLFLWWSSCVKYMNLYLLVNAYSVWYVANLVKIPITNVKNFSVFGIITSGVR
jgi:hypothetical protein